MCDTWPHHRLLHADELRNAPSPFFISSEKSLLKVIWARADSPALGLAVRGGELFNLLTWMNCWGNVEAGNGWIVYINMINIALINHLSVIYCCFSTLGSDLGNSAECHRGASLYPGRAGPGSSASPPVGTWSKQLPHDRSHCSQASLLVCFGFCRNSRWGGKTEANAKATACARGRTDRIHNILFRAWRIFSFWAKFYFGFPLSEQECCVLERAPWFPVRRSWKASHLTWPAFSLVQLSERCCLNRHLL